jgi:hypothetical protein
MALTTAANAQLWVSNTGSDANNCSLPAPCRTLQEAVDSAFPWAQISALNASDYGPVTINKPLSIDGGGFISNFSSGAVGITVNMGSSGGVVQLHNLRIHGGLTGISMTGAGALDIDNVQVTGVSGNCINVAQTGTTDVVIKDSTVENCSGAGISVGTIGANFNTTVKIINTHVRFANTGLFVNNVAASIFNSTFSSPGLPSTGTVGISTSQSSILVDNCEVIGFGTGISAASGGGLSLVTVSRSSFFNNALGVNSVGTNIQSRGNNTFADNINDGTFTSTLPLK